MARYDIRNGPSKLDLALSLIDGEDHDAPRSVHLVLFSHVTESGCERELRVTQIRRDREKKEWVIEGVLEGPVRDVRVANWNEAVKVTGRYSTLTHTGHLETAA